MIAEMKISIVGLGNTIWVISHKIDPRKNNDKYERRGT